MHRFAQPAKEHVYRVAKGYHRSYARAAARILLQAWGRIDCCARLPSYDSLVSVIMNKYGDDCNAGPGAAHRAVVYFGNPSAPRDDEIAVLLDSDYRLLPTLKCTKFASISAFFDRQRDALCCFTLTFPQWIAFRQFCINRQGFVFGPQDLSVPCPQAEHRSHVHLAFVVDVAQTLGGKVCFRDSLSAVPSTDRFYVESLRVLDFANLELYDVTPAGGDMHPDLVARGQLPLLECKPRIDSVRLELKDPSGSTGATPTASMLEGTFDGEPCLVARIEASQLSRLLAPPHPNVLHVHGFRDVPPPPLPRNEQTTTAPPAAVPLLDVVMEMPNGNLNFIPAARARRLHILHDVASAMVHLQQHGASDVAQHIGNIIRPRHIYSVGAVWKLCCIDPQLASTTSTVDTTESAHDRLVELIKFLGLSDLLPCGDAVLRSQQHDDDAGSAGTSTIRPPALLQWPDVLQWTMAALQRDFAEGGPLDAVYRQMKQWLRVMRAAVQQRPRVAHLGDVGFMLASVSRMLQQHVEALDEVEPSAGLETRVAAARNAAPSAVGTSALHFVERLKFCSELTDASLREVVTHCTPLKHLDVAGCDQLTDASLRELATHCPQLQHLNVAGCDQVTDESLRAVVTNCPQLQYLDVAGCDQLTDASLRELATHCPQLQHLNVAGCDEVTDASLREVATQCSQLQHLDVAGCDLVTDVSLRAVVTNCPQLRYLNVAGCNQVTDASLREVATQLQHLDVAGCNQVTDESLREVATHCPQLQHLNVSSCPQLSNAALLEVATHCKQLDHLNVAGCNQVTDATVRELATQCPQLQHLDVAGCNQLTDESLREVATHCPQLQYLNVAGCNQVTDQSLREVATHCPQLQHLNVSSCPQVTNAALLEVATHCKQLQHLDVAGCNQVTDASLRRLAKLCPQLQHLAVAGCKDLTNAALIDVAKHSGQLRHLDVAGCERLTNASISEVAQRCRQLRYLDVAQCVKLSDAAVRDVAMHCQWLQYLNLSHCDRLTNPSLRELATHCKRLRRLDVSYCDKLAAARVRELSTQCPQLHISHQTSRPPSG